MLHVERVLQNSMIKPVRRKFQKAEEVRKFYNRNQFSMKNADPNQRYAIIGYTIRNIKKCTKDYEKTSH